MELKPGYKQTEVGVIPEDWEVASLEAITTRIGDGLHGTPIYSQNGKHFFVNGNNLRDGKIIITDDTQSVDYSEFNKHRKPLSNRTILLSINGTIGNLALLDNEDIVLGKSAAYLNVKRDTSKLFVYFSLQTQTVKNQFFDGMTGSTIGNLGLATIRETHIPIPKTKTEQKAIATALSDTDALLNGLDRLIAKKRDLKQAAMQQLLTGKTRLPGFEGGWVNCGLPEVLVKGDGIKIGPFGSQLKKEYLVQNGLYRVYGQENVYQSNFSFGTRYLTRERFEKLKSCEIKPGDFVISTMGTIGKCAIVPPDICVGIMDSHLIRLRIDQSKLLPQYLLHLFSSDFHYLENQTSKLSVGGIMDGLSTKIVRALEIEYPKSPEEQTAIASVLSDMDAEIVALEQRRAKTKDIKQAMMQELLTGKTRLVTPGGSNA